ncbi:MAG TPA: hypothetical protein PKH63_03040 [Actinomycetota bacterium]|nr:hypothetical protein [Actinomycetota bacterium]
MRTFTASTATAGRLFPFVAGAGAPAAGVPVGSHLHWGEAVSVDPFAWLTAGLTTNTGMFHLGQPGTGKSAFAKRQIVGMVAQGVQPVVLGDVKGEYALLVARLGGQVIRVGRGLDRLNPLDTPGDPSGMDARGRRLNLLMALCATVRRDRPLSNGEQVLLSAAVDEVVRRGGQVLVPQILHTLQEPSAELFTAAQVRTLADYDAMSKHLRWTLGLLCGGTLQGVFDGPSTRAFDPRAPAIAVDLSAVDDDLLLSAAMLCTWSWGQAAVQAAAGESGSRWLLVMDELWRVLTGAPGLIDHVDALTRLNRSRGVGSLMITHSLRDLEALPGPQDVAKAMGFVERSAIVVLSGLPRRELDVVGRVVPLSEQEKSLVAAWASADSWRPGTRHPGRGRYLIKTGHRPGLPVAMRLTDTEARLFDTDAPALSQADRR